MYIGAAKVPLRRIYVHRGIMESKLRRGRGWRGARAMIFDEVRIRSCPLGEMLALERELIQKHTPKYNIIHNPKPHKWADASMPVTLTVGRTKLVIGAKPQRPVIERRELYVVPEPIYVPPPPVPKPPMSRAYWNAPLERRI